MPRVSISDVLAYIRYINLEHRKDRKAHIEEELRKLHPDCKPLRLNAIRASRLHVTREDHRGHLGCTMSHMKVFEEAMKTNHDYVCVFEDDAIFTHPKSTLKKLEHVVNTHDWDVILLGCAGQESTPVDEHCERLLYAYNAHAYIVKRKFLPILRDCFARSKEMLSKGIRPRLERPLEGGVQIPACHDQYWQTLMKDHIFLALLPVEVKQLPSFSDILQRHVTK